MRNTSKIKDLTGQKFNHLTVIGIAERNPLKWECQCDCGNTTGVRTCNLTRGLVKSCGCIHHRGNPTHGQCYTRVYRIYAKILRRCFVTDDPAYKNYGGRGITMCEEWRNSFEAFSEWAYSNGYADGKTIDRIDNNGDYSPENCRWATPSEQANNTRRNRNFTLNGKTQTLAQWCNEYGAKYGTVHQRLKMGWTFEEAISLPKNTRAHKRGKESKSD